MGYPLDHFDDVDLIVVFADLLDRSLKAGGFNDVPVVQLEQPTIQARGESGVFFQFIFDDKIGWTTSDYHWDDVAQNFVFNERQHMHGTVRVSVLYPFDPLQHDPATRRTAKDLANYLSQKLNSSNYRMFFRKAGIGILRTPNVRPNPFENDRGQYEFMPSFDLEMVYNRKINETVPPIVEIMGELFRV